MRRVLRAGGVVLVLLLLALLVATWRLSQPKFEESLRGDPLDSLVIAPPAAALTLARVETGAGPRVVLVARGAGGRLEVVDLEAAFGQPFRDAVEAFAVLGFEALERTVDAAATLRVSVADLTLPLDLSDRHIAAGTNFRAHAEEVGRDEGPFLFPKLSRATPWNAEVPARRRLDYEAELCAVTLTPHTALRPARLGYLLCNDFTDRWTLVRDIDLDAPMGTTGFPDAKGGEGMLPVGFLLLIPRDADAFYRDLTLELYVNGSLRQRALGGQMIWSPAQIASRALEDCDVAYHRRDGSIGLTDCAAIPPRTLLLTGTPGGVMFHPLTLWSAGAYLGPGDEVITLASHLGVLRNRVR
jgi:2-keto-4-pentenoate hydratase/2-oxohepta-3-ene-1,7-dioic acid hydratase in catechol pathway